VLFVVKNVIFDAVYRSMMGCILQQECDVFVAEMLQLCELLLRLENKVLGGEYAQVVAFLVQWGRHRR
jgi:hypothetical protein